MSGKQKNILVIEDNLETQLLIKVTLRDKYKLELTSNPEEAMRKIKDGLFDLVLLDINLNDEVNGRDILSITRNSFDLKKLPVIVMTAYDLSESDKNFFDECANRLIAKPLDKNVLIKEIENLLNNN